MNMIERLEKFGELADKYPELFRAGQTSNNVLIITNIDSSDKEVENAFANLGKILEDNPQQKKIDEAIKTMKIVFGTFKTREELIDWSAKQQNTFITILTTVYINITDMK